MPILELSFASGESSLSVRHFAVRESISSLFEVFVLARSANPSVPIASLVGQPATFRMGSAYLHSLRGGTRTWSGVVSYIEQTQAVYMAGGAEELSTYALRIVPSLWLLTQRRRNRIFQHLTIPDIIGKILGEWGLQAVWRIDRNLYPKLEYKVQYAETDFDFVNRLLEEAGISYLFQDENDAGSVLTLIDRPEGAKARETPPIPFVDNPSHSSEREYTTAVELIHEVRPGAYTLRDYDFRNPAYPLFGEAPKAQGREAKYEQYHYRAGSHLVEVGKTGSTPVADDLGFARHFQPAGHARAERSLVAERTGKRAVAFQTNVVDLWPGVIFHIGHHPHPELSEDAGLLVLEQSIEGTPEGEWVMSGKAVFSAEPYRPALRTAKPRIRGVQSAVVVGPVGEEIHTDEFGRVRVQFPWDREGTFDDKSSCWIRVSQGWSGSSYGLMTLPRIGHEVLVNFLNGDPDMPIVMGRAYNAVEPVPYRLPQTKTQSMWRSETTPSGNGFNEILYEDQKADELLSIQAERNQRVLVKNDETITVGNDRRKHVDAEEWDLTVVNRTQVTGVNRIEVTGAYDHLLVGQNSMKYVGGNVTRRLEMNRFIVVDKNQDLVTKGNHKELVEDDVHLNVDGDARLKVGVSQSLTVNGNYDEKIGRNYAHASGKQSHFKSGTAFTIEAGKDITIAGPGGFIRIDAAGIAIGGTVVKINAGGTAGNGRGATPELPELPQNARVDEPELPDLPDVREVSPPNIAPDKRVVISLQWSRSRMEVGKKAYATFYVSGFRGGEEATVRVFEGSGDGRKLIETVLSRLERGRGRMRVPWTRGGKDAEADLAKADQVVRESPLEYRFEVNVGSVKGEGDSGPLWLTKTIVVDLREWVLKVEGGKQESLPPDGTRVVVTGADGAASIATTKRGKARVNSVVIGKQISVRVEPQKNEEGEG